MFNTNLKLKEMKNKDLMQNLIEMQEEESQMDMIVNKSLQLALSINEHKKANFKENHQQYIDSYNLVCERIADMKLAIDVSEFLFNADSINTHYENNILNFTTILN